MELYISHNIKYLLDREKWDHATFAAHFDVSRAMISHYTLDKATPKIDTLVKISRYFNISLDDLVTTPLGIKTVYINVENNQEIKKQDVDGMNGNNYSTRIKDLEKTIEVQDRLINSLEQQLSDQPKAAS